MSLSKIHIFLAILSVNVQLHSADGRSKTDAFLDAFIEKLRLIFLITLSSAASSFSIRKTKIACGIAFCPSTITDTAVS